MDALIQLIRELIEMAKTNAWFWLILVVVSAPAVLWWWNTLRKQWALSGIKEYLVRVVRKKDTIPSVAPSPRSGKAFVLWKELLPWMILVFFLSTLAMTAINNPLSAQWWKMYGIVVLFFIIMGIPTYVMDISSYVQISKRLNKAIALLSTKYADCENGKDTYLNVFLSLADEFSMGIDPAVISLKRDCGGEAVGYSMLSEFVGLYLVRPDSKVPDGALAHRYYLTRTGATLIRQQQHKMKGGLTG